MKILTLRNRISGLILILLLAAFPCYAKSREVNISGLLEESDGKNSSDLTTPLRAIRRLIYSV